MTAMPPEMPPEPPGGKVNFLTKLLISKAGKIALASTAAGATIVAGVFGVEAFRADPPAPTPALVTPEPTDNQSLLIKYGSDFDAWRQQTYDILLKQNYITSTHRFVTVATGPKDAYGSQDILNQVALDVADASLQVPIVNGERMLSLVEDPKLGNYQDDMRYFDAHKGHQPDVNLHRVAGRSFQLTGYFNGVDLTPYTRATLIEQEFIPSPGDNPTALHRVWPLRAYSEQQPARVATYEALDAG